MCRRQAFTLIEVLVVVAIIALFLAILVQLLARARANARSAVCLSNLHQFSLALMSYSADSKGVIPGETGAGDEGWSSAVARMIKIRPVWRTGPSNRYIYLPVEKPGVFQCPERRRNSPTPFLDYVHNTLHPDGPTGDGNWTPVIGGVERKRRHIAIDQYRRPGDVLFICDAEREDRVPQVDGSNGYDPSVAVAAKEWADHNFVPGDDFGIDVMDIRTGAHVPEGRDGLNQTDGVGPRRAARKMHLDRFTNGFFLDGHGAGVPTANKFLPSGQPDHRANYAYWLRLFGVTDPVAAAARPCL